MRTDQFTKTYDNHETAATDLKLEVEEGLFIVFAVPPSAMRPVL